MLEWCMAHPWMTFFLAVLVIECLSNLFKVVAWLIQKSIKEKSHEN